MAALIHICIITFQVEKFLLPIVIQVSPVKFLFLSCDYFSASKLHLFPVGLEF